MDDYREKRRIPRDAVNEVARGSWQQRVEKRGLAVVDGPTWNEFRTGQVSSACRALARLAKQVERAQELAEKDFHELVLGVDGEPVNATRRVAAAVGVAVLKRTADLRQVALAMRVLGVFLCASTGRAETCLCWQALVRTHGVDAAKEKLAQGLPEQLAE